MTTGKVIPVSFLLKMGMYDIEVEEGVTIKTRVLDHGDVIDSCIPNFTSSLAGRHIVGLDVKSSSEGVPKLLILCAETQCLIIRILESTDLPYSLWNFLNDKSICFVGFQLSRKIEELRGKWKSSFPPLETGVELGYLAARALNKPSLCNVWLRTLAKEVGIIAYRIKFKESKDCPNWAADVFSDEEIEYAMINADAYYVLGKKILGLSDGGYC